MHIICHHLCVTLWQNLEWIIFSFPVVKCSKKKKTQKTKQNKYLHQHTYFSYFPNPLRLGNLYFLYVTLDLSTLHARYYTHPNTPRHNNTAMLRHTHTNFHTVLKEKHFLFFFCFQDISTRKYDTNDAPLILMKQQCGKQGHIFNHNYTCNLWVIHHSDQVGPV